MAYARFSTRAEAQAFIDSLNAELGYPHVGVNAKTGLPAPGKQQATTYSDIIESSDGNSFVVPFETGKSFGKLDTQIRSKEASKEDLIRDFNFDRDKL